MAYEINWEGNNAIINYIGKVSFEEIVESINNITGDKRFDKLKFQIGDFSHTQEFNIPDNAAELVFAFDKISMRWNTKMKIATVTTNKEFIEHVKQYNQLFEDTPCQAQIFSSFEDAISWCKKD